MGYPHDQDKNLGWGYAVTGGGGLAGHATASVLWTASQKWASRITGLVTVAVLARVLSAADFGVVAVAVSLLPLVQLLADFGFSTYLVQTERPTNRTFATAFWYSALAGVVLGGALLLLAPVLGALLGIPDVVPVVRGLAPAALLVTLGSVPMARLRREMQFRTLAIQGVIAGVVGQVVAITMALMGFGVWALVAQTLVIQAVGTSLAWSKANWRPSLDFSWAELGLMSRFGTSVVAVEFVTMTRVWLENAIVAAALGINGLGYLSIAQRLISTAQDLTSSALVPVSVVVFSQIRATSERLKSAYLRAQTVSLMIMVPILLLIAVGAPILVPLIFGDKWAVSVAPAQVLAVAGIVTMGALDQGLFYGLGKPGTWLKYAIVVDGMTALVTYFAARHGLLAIAVGFLCVAATATLMRWVLVGLQLRSPWWQMAQPWVRISIPAMCTAAVGYGMSVAVRGLPSLLALGAIGATIMAVYLPLVKIMLPATWAELLSFGNSAGRRLFRRSQEAG